VEDLPDAVDVLGREVAVEESFHLTDSLIGDPDVWSREACEVETSIQNRKSLASKLLFDLLILDDQWVHRLVESETEVGLPEPVNDIEDGMRPAVGTDAPWITSVQGRDLHVLLSLLPGEVEVLGGSLPNAGWIELHEGGIGPPLFKTFGSGKVGWFIRLDPVLADRVGIRVVGWALKWLKKIFSKEKAGPGRQDEAETPPKLALSYVEEWLAVRSQEPEFDERVRSLYAAIERLAGEFESDLLALEKAVPREDAPPRLLKAGTATRETVARQMRVLSERLSPPARADLASAKEYHSAMLKQLQNTVQKLGRAQKYTAALFSQEADAINSDLGAISRHLAEMGEAVQEREASLGAFREAAALASRARGAQDQVEALLAEISEDEGILAVLRDREKGHQKEIETWTRSDEGKRTLDEKRAFEQKQREIDQIEMSMADLVSPLTKALSRAVKQDSSDRIALQHRDVFELLSGSPARALEGDVSGALLELKSKVDLLGLRDKKRDRIIEQIDHLLEDRPLEVLKARHQALSREIEKLEESLSRSGRESGRLREKRDQVRQKIPALEAELEDRKRSLAALEERLSGDLADLERKLEEISEGPVEIDPHR